jgi:uncharacterized membrane protein YedE/YeeE
MRNPFTKAAWSPYTVGTGIGILTWFTFLIMHKAPSTTATFVRFVGFLIGIFSLEHIAYTPYFSKYVEFKPVFEWQFALVIGLFFGAWLAAKLSNVTFAYIPYLWGQNFGFSKQTRAIGAFIGGFLLLFGARLAGGCTLGHGVAGGLQLVIISWLFLCVAFTAGIISAKILYRNK